MSRFDWPDVPLSEIQRRFWDQARTRAGLEDVMVRDGAVSHAQSVLEALISRAGAGKAATLPRKIAFIQRYGIHLPENFPWAVDVRNRDSHTVEPLHPSTAVGADDNGSADTTLSWDLTWAIAGARVARYCEILDGFDLDVGGTPQAASQVAGGTKDIPEGG